MKAPDRPESIQTSDSSALAAMMKFSAPSTCALIDQSMLMMRALRFNAAFADWPAAAITQLISSATLKSYKRGCWIAHEPNERSDILVIVSGFLLMRRRTPEGELHSVGLVGSGRIVSRRCELMWTPQIDLTYSSHDDAKVIHLNHDTFFSQLNAEPMLWKSVLAGALLQRREFVETLLDQTIGCAPQRIARLIMRYAELYGMRMREADGTRVPIRLPQGELGALLQLSRQTISETIKSFRDAGWIRLDRATFTVLNQLALHQFAQGRNLPRVDADCLCEDEAAGNAIAA